MSVKNDKTVIAKNTLVRKGYEIAATHRRKNLLASVSLNILAAVGQLNLQYRTLNKVGLVALGVLAAPIAAQAHTDSLGYILTPGSAEGLYNARIVYGSWHSGTVNPEGSADLSKDGTKIKTEVFSIYLANVSNGTLPDDLTVGTNYFYASQDGESLTTTPHSSGVYNFQSAYFIDLTPGTYTFNYAPGQLSDVWRPAGNAISKGTFIITADGGIEVPGAPSTATDIAGAGTSYDASNLGDSVNSVFTGGTLVADQNNQTHSNNFTLDSSASNTIDANGNITTFTGTFSDVDSAQPGKITFADSSANGNGKVTLTGENTHTGGTMLNSGTLALSGNGTLGANSNTTTVNGGTLELGGTDQTQRALVQTDGTVQNGSVSVFDYTLSGGTLARNATIDASHLIAVSAGQVDGVLNGSAALTKSGSGTVTLTNGNGYTGGTSLDEGTLALSGNGTLGANSNTTTVNGGVLELGGTGQTQRALVQTDGTVQNGSVSVFDYTLSGGTLASNATINASQSIAVSAGQVDGVLNGSAALTKSGSGTVTLTNGNGYTGGTSLDAGTLALSGNGTLGANSNTTTVNGGTLELGGTDQTQRALVQTDGTVQNGGVSVVDYTLSGGTLASNATIDASQSIAVSAGQVDGVLNGSAALTKTGSGTVTLTNTNNYSGGTTIQNGILVVGNGGTAGSITGDVVNDGTLVINRSDRVDFAGNISGAGSVVLAGGGTTQLADNNLYSGGTTVANSVVWGSASSFGTGQISNNGVVVFNQQQIGNLANALTGAGSFVKVGTNALELSSSGDFNGTFYVEEGSLAVNSQLVHGDFQIGSGALLSGTGGLGSLTLRKGSTLATGNSIGTLTVAGNVVQQNGSFWNVELAQSGINDSLVAGGTVTIEDGVVLNVANVTGVRYALDDTFTVLSAQNGVSGTYTLAGDTYISTFYGLIADYSDPNSVVLRVAQSRQFDQLSGLNKNQNAVAGALQSLGIDNPLYQAISYLNDENEAKSAFTQLSGEIHASAHAVTLEDSRFVRDAALGRLRTIMGGVSGGSAADTVADSGLSWWSHGFGSDGRFENTSNNGASDLDRTIAGGFAGVDTVVGDAWRIGALAGYSHSNFDTRWLNSSGKATSYHVGLYGGGKAGVIDVKLGAAYSWQDIDTARSVSFTGFSDSLSASYRNQVTQIFGEASHQFDVQGVALEPFANLAYVHLHSGSFTEDGGAAALKGASDNSGTLFSTIGLRASTVVSEDGATKLYGSAAWRHAYNDLTPDSRLSFASGGSAFSTGGVPVAKNLAVLELGLDRKFTDGLSIGVSYSGQIGNGSQDHGAKAQLQWKF
ncbi:autotransporter domain-containing protein [Brucella sp. BE17]|uniref:autotransporter domain-containing protein n=1 Tax=Brucella sp. BE17 TaxID=3142977 RepID=UPI0031B9DE41